MITDLREDDEGTYKLELANKDGKAESATNLIMEAPAKVHVPDRFTRSLFKRLDAYGCGDIPAMASPKSLTSERPSSSK